MTQAEETHHLSQTTCMHLGTHCPALTRMLQALATAMTKASALTDADFAFSGESFLDGCNRRCPARFVASHARIRVFCDVTPDADTAELDLFADTLLLSASPGSPASRIKQRPCAFGEVLPRHLHQQSAPKTRLAAI